jgi:hypothetical protein
MVSVLAIPAQPTDTLTAEVEMPRWLSEEVANYLDDNVLSFDELVMSAVCLFLLQRGRTLQNPNEVANSYLNSLPGCH